MLTEENALKGILICLLSYFFISLIGLFEKAISHAITVPVILFFQNIICLAFIVMERARHGDMSLKTQNLNTHLIRIASGLGCYAVLFYIIRFIPISEALVYQYSASLWIPFIMLFWLNVRMPKKLWYGIIVGFVGILLVLEPSAAMVNKIALYGILCGILQALSMVAIRKLTMTDPISRILLYYFLAGTIVLSPFVIQHWSPLDGKDFLLLIGVGLSTFIAQKFFTLSLKYASPTTLAPICYTSILFSGIFAWIFWHEMPNIEEVFGMSLIVLGCALTVFMSRPKAEPLTVMTPTLTPQQQPDAD